MVRFCSGFPKFHTEFHIDASSALTLTMIPTENKNTIHFKQWLLPNCLPCDLEILTVNGGEKLSRFNTQLTVANFTGKRKKIKSGYFIATPRIMVLTGGNRSTGKRTCHISTLFTTDPMSVDVIKYLIYQLACSLNHTLTARSRVLIGKLPGSQSRNSPHLLVTNVHYRIHNSPPNVTVLSQLDLVHTPTPHFLKINFNIILLSTPVYSKWSLSLGFHNQKPVCNSTHPHARYILHPSHSSRFYHRTILGEQYRSLSSS